MGLARPLMRAAVDNMRAAGVHTAYLEVVTKNVKAIAAYEGSGFRIVDDLIGLKQSGAFDTAPFQHAGGDHPEYSIRSGNPADVVALPFFLPHSSWGGQWFQLQASGGDSLQVLNSAGETVGYALYNNHYNDLGKVTAVSLSHIEVAPGHSDSAADAIIRTALTHLFIPSDSEIARHTDNLRASNPLVMAALIEAGFETVYEQKLMLIEF
jgi:L-amino acid N-acyltransferase YncA